MSACDFKIYKVSTQEYTGAVTEQKNVLISGVENDTIEVVVEEKTYKYNTGLSLAGNYLEAFCGLCGVDEDHPWYKYNDIIIIIIIVTKPDGSTEVWVHELEER